MSLEGCDFYVLSCHSICECVSGQEDWGMIPYEYQNEEKGLEKYSLTLSLRRILIDTSNRVFNSAKNF